MLYRKYKVYFRFVRSYILDFRIKNKEQRAKTLTSWFFVLLSFV